MRRPVPSLTLFTLLLTLFAVLPDAARADEQFGSRGGLSFGQRSLHGKSEFITALSLDSDMLIGPNRHNAFRWGLAGEGRTVNLHTIEGAGGLTVLLPLPFSMAAQLTGLIGLAWRPGHGNPDGWMGIGTGTIGWRGYNYHGWYSYGLYLFGSGRKQINNDLMEWTAGVQVDILFTTVIPFLAIKNALSKKDPYEE